MPEQLVKRRHFAPCAVDRGVPLTQARRDEIADAIEGMAYWACAGGEPGTAERLAQLLAWACASLRGEMARP
jgi:hypothetical protein